MDKDKAAEFINEYVELCKKYDMYLWSGEPWYGLDLLGGNVSEEIIRKNIMVYDD